MFRSELLPLEKLVTELLNDEHSGDSGRKADWVAERVERVSAACEDLKNKWLQKLFSSVKELVIIRYVQYHQAGIIALSNQVSQKIPAPFSSAPAELIHQAYVAVVGRLEDLVWFLQSRFSKFFDKDQLVSAACFRQESERILRLLDQVTTSLKESSMDTRLIAAIERSFQTQLRDAQHFGISRRGLEYDQAILSLILHLVTSTGLTTVSLSEELYRQNFNSFYFGQWYQHQLQSNMAEAPEKKRDATIEKEINALAELFMEKSKCFDGELLPIDIQLLSWLQLQFSPKHTSFMRENILVKEHDRMPLNLSVAQFALLVRLCYLEGCFHLNNVSQIIRFFTSHYETKKQLNLSLKSFARAFYGTDQATAAFIRDLLQRMIAFINKTYFP